MSRNRLALGYEARRFNTTNESTPGDTPPFGQSNFRLRSDGSGLDYSNASANALSGNHRQAAENTDSKSDTLVLFIQERQSHLDRLSAQISAVDIESCKDAASLDSNKLLLMNSVMQLKNIMNDAAACLRGLSGTGEDVRGSRNEAPQIPVCNREVLRGSDSSASRARKRPRSPDLEPLDPEKHVRRRTGAQSHLGSSKRANPGLMGIPHSRPDQMPNIRGTGTPSQLGSVGPAPPYVGEQTAHDHAVQGFNAAIPRQRTQAQNNVSQSALSNGQPSSPGDRQTPQIQPFRRNTHVTHDPEALLLNQFEEDFSTRAAEQQPVGLPVWGGSRRRKGSEPTALGLEHLQAGNTARSLLEKASPSTHSRKDQMDTDLGKTKSKAKPAAVKRRGKANERNEQAPVSNSAWQFNFADILGRLDILTPGVPELKTSALSIPDTLREAFAQSLHKVFTTKKRLDTLDTGARQPLCARQRVSGRKVQIHGEMFACPDCLSRGDLCIKKIAGQTPIIVPLPAEDRGDQPWDSPGYWLMGQIQ